ncbi:alpha/beta fold hydrolase, partial [Tropicimonas sp.]|uniref:alpha/beta fold hydrolase n=1 Tax=Tropicimonas sp. TaxID=2067044 RepID=UPI003A889564
GGGVARFFPEQWQRFAGLLPEEERGDIIGAYARRLFSDDSTEQVRHARAWAAWENALASIAGNGAGGESAAEYARAFARIENHYFRHLGWLERDGQILDNMPLISHIPGTVVQGRYDMICPPTGAWRLTRRWPRAKLRMVGMAGHAISETGITEALVETTDGIARQAPRYGF